MSMEITDAEKTALIERVFDRFAANKKLNLTDANWRDAPKEEIDGVTCMIVEPIIEETLAIPRVGEQLFQARVQPWMLECFGPEISGDRLERNDRFIEEALELVQATGYSADRAHTVVDYVFGRPVGEPMQEAGGVMVTLAALCLAHGLDMHAAGETELARINQPHVIEKIRAKQAAKPTGSALPIAQPTPANPGDAVERVEELAMTAFSDAAPVRDEFMGEQSILTYNENVGVYGLEFFESRDEFPDRWLGSSHWMDITGMWPGVRAQVTEFRKDALREALQLARPIVEADLETAKDYSDADWIGMSQEALDAIDIVLAAHRGEKAEL